MVRFSVKGDQKLVACTQVGNGSIAGKVVAWLPRFEYRYYFEAFEILWKLLSSKGALRGFNDFKALVTSS